LSGNRRSAWLNQFILLLIESKELPRKTEKEPNMFSLPSLERENILGVGVSIVNMDTAIRTINDWIDGGERQYVCVTGVHGVMESQRSAEIRRIHNEAGMVTPDGMPLAWLLRAAGHKSADRVCGPELMPRLLIESQNRGHRHYFYGTTPETLRRLEQRLREIAPTVRIVGSYAPPFRALTPEEDDAVVVHINDCAPDIVWVGLSTPKQELWMASHRARINAPVLVGVGAAFDITADIRSRAPRFIRRSGFEWTWRLVIEPRRLWRRHLKNNPLFVALIALQQLGVLRPPAEY
jgi:N-acetylglucosaminyldiphosphoundecaprenol N-acetyl-beta-D-mannosaminyltransferase